MSTFPSRLLNLQQKVRSVVASEIAPRAAQVDLDGTWPSHSMDALHGAGLMGLQVPEELGGHGEGLLALSLVTEEVGKSCPSSALCFGMHCVGTAVIAAKATDYQKETYLKPIAAGRHITTLALSEKGTGSHFYLPATKAEQDGQGLVVTGEKQFVTNGGHADSYVMSVNSVGPQESGDFSCLVVDAGAQGLEWGDQWRGMGMRGNSSRTIQLRSVRLSGNNLLGEVGDQVWYVFDVVAPFFLVAMAGTYVGIAQGALDLARQHLVDRRYSHTGAALGTFDVLQTRLAGMWIMVEKARSMLRAACSKGDLRSLDALHYLLACKIEASEAAVAVTDEAMTICGGSAYRDNSRLAQLLRDARASHVMAPTTDLLKLWLGRSLLGLPLL